VPSGALSSGVARITGNNSAFAALKTDGSVVTWGAADQGGDSTLANGTTTAAPAGALASGVDHIASPFWHDSSPGAPSDATLSALTLSAGTLSPAFSTSTLSYTASVPAETTSITVTPTVNAGGATTTVNGATVSSGAASAPIGANAITIVVTAPDATTTRTYTVSLTRAAAADAGPSGASGTGGSGTPTATRTDGTASSPITVSNPVRSGRTVTTKVTVTGPGSIRQVGSLAARRGGAACTVTRTAKKAGTYKLSCRLRATKGTLTLVTTFTPKGGAPTGVTSRLRLG
jgi:hypothetical protein